jgi:hypothetical protein
MMMMMMMLAGPINHTWLKNIFHTLNIFWGLKTKQIRDDIIFSTFLEEIILVKWFWMQWQLQRWQAAAAPWEIIYHHDQVVLEN